MATVWSKRWLTTKTAIFNGIILLASVSGAAVEILDALGIKQGRAVAIVGGIAGVGNILLRRVTKQPVTLRGNDPVQVPSP